MQIIFLCLSRVLCGFCNCPIAPSCLIQRISFWIHAVRGCFSVLAFRFAVWRQQFAQSPLYAGHGSVDVLDEFLILGGMG